MSLNPTLLSHRTVYANLKVLSELKNGDKVTIDHNTGAMTKHEPYYGETLGRWWSGAFNTDIVKQTFTQAFDVLQLEDDADDKVRTYGHLADLIPTGFEGIDVLRSTYKAEKKSQVTKALKAITKQFEERVEGLQNQKVEAVQDISTSSTTSTPRSENVDEEVFVTSVVDLEEEIEEESKSQPVRNRRIKKVDQRALIDSPPQQKTAKKTSKWKMLFCCVKGTD